MAERRLLVVLCKGHHLDIGIFGMAGFRSGFRSLGGRLLLNDRINVS